MAGKSVHDGVLHVPSKSRYCYQLPCAVHIVLEKQVSKGKSRAL